MIGLWSCEQYFFDFFDDLHCAYASFDLFHGFSRLSQVDFDLAELVEVEFGLLCPLLHQLLQLLRPVLLLYLLLFCPLLNLVVQNVVGPLDDGRLLHVLLDRLMSGGFLNALDVLGGLLVRNGLLPDLRPAGGRVVGRLVVVHGVEPELEPL